MARLARFLIEGARPSAEKPRVFAAPSAYCEKPSMT